MKKIDAKKKEDKQVTVKLPADLLDSFKTEFEKIGWNQKTGFSIAMKLFIKASINQKLDIAKELFGEE